jgi:hypothetical protein
MRTTTRIPTALPTAALLLVAVLGCRSHPGASSTGAPVDGVLPTIDAFATGFEPVPGLVPLWWDAAAGRLYVELPPERSPFLYWVSLPAGLGSNDVGLDRGQIGTRQLVETRRVGRRVLLVAPNTTWRSSSGDEAAQRAARESFAESVVFGFDVVAEQDGRALVDASDFFLRDAHDVRTKLQGAGQGRFDLERSRSLVLAADAKGFLDNTMVDALLTFTSDAPGREVRSTAADARSVSLRVRHSFVRLPEPGYRPRRFHPRSGFFSESYNDIDAPLHEPLARHFLARHRLEKRDPTQASSEALRPIVYYIDRGAPEPVRTALLDGARYWEPVFEAAGFPGGFRAELLPEGADVHDARYNVVQWVDRSTRGWSYGDAVVDPRTGEILKGHVTLGALRVRQDVLLAEGLLSPHDGRADDSRAVDMALARIRQLSAHEIGHTLGLAHNFAASADWRASVMDYPAPLVRIDDDGRLDLSDAYRDGCGEWDEIAIRYGYSDFAHLSGATADEKEAKGLRGVLADADARGLDFLTDRDARGNDRAHPLANLWDNGTDPVEYFAHELAVRRAALERFSEAAVRLGRPLAELEEVLVPVYLHHRYQLEAAVRSLGGATYGYDLRGDQRDPVTPVPAERQERALALALQTLRPDFLALPDALRGLIPPRPPGSAAHREQFRPGALFLDPLVAAAASMELTLELLLDPGRATRLVDQARRDPSLPSFQTVLDALAREALATPGAHDIDVRGELRLRVVDHLMRLADDRDAPARVRAPAFAALVAIRSSVEPESWLGGRLRRYFEDPDSVLDSIDVPRVPPGSPIGCGFAR